MPHRVTLLVAVQVALLTAMQTTSLANEQESRPNILFAFADDWGRFASAYSKLKPGSMCDVVKTPNFDRVAREGVLMTHAFVNAPSCTPCRSSILSGQYFFRCDRGAILQGAVWNPEIPSYPLILEDSGYAIGFTYKVWSPGTPANAPYGGKRNAFAKFGSRFNGFSQFVSKSDDIEGAKQTLYDEVRNNFDAFLTKRQSNQPFCYWFGPTNCHRKWVKGSGKLLWNIDPESLKGKLPAFLPDVPDVREDLADYLGEVQAFDEGLGVLLKRLEELGELDNTIVVVSGDHGAPGFPSGKCNLYDFGVHVALAIRWGNNVPGGRTITDFVNLMDLAPTFLEAAGCEVPEAMTGQSLLPVLQSEASGRIDPQRDFVVVGRERHVAQVRQGQLPYPQRAIRTDDFLYIRNFAPERWPMGEAMGYGLPPETWPSNEQLTNDTFAAFGDMDASPTKAWLILNHDSQQWQPFFNRAFGIRPPEELYDLKTDPDQITNLADQTGYQEQREHLRGRLLSILQTANDPRLTEDPPRFELPPYAGPIQ
jgi:N-sulfoglucosamine sulfohydrolase